MLRGFGLRQGSLTFPLHMPQVQTLLLRRYWKLADLQFSCWQAPPGTQACSACSKCFEIALVTLSQGVTPRAVGIDPVRALLASSERTLGGPPRHRGPTLSEHRSPRHHVIRALQARSTGEVASILSADPVTTHGGRIGEALAIYARLRAEALAVTLPPEPGYVTDFLDLVHSDLRQPLRSILAQHFPPTSEPEFRAMSKRARALAAWIGEPLHADRRKRSWRRGG